MYEIPNSPGARRGRIRRKQPIEVLNDSSWEQLAELTQSSFSIRFKVRGGFRPEKPAEISNVRLAFQSALRFAAISDAMVVGLALIGSYVSICFKVHGGFRLATFGVTALFWAAFQSALRFAVVSDLTPWHAVLTSPVVAVLHTTPPHSLQPRDRNCPQWGKTPRHVPYTPEVVFDRSPTPLPRC